VSSRRTLILGTTVVIVIAAAAYSTRHLWSPEGAVAQAPQRPPARVVPVEVTKALKKQVPVRVDALGAVTPISSVAIKSRLETTIVEVHFADGARVKEGEPLFTLDSRALEAQIRQAEGVIARDKAQLEGAERDVRRYSELVAKSATPVTNLDNAKTQADSYRASIKTNEAALENLKVTLSYTRITAPISGRIGAASVRVGNFVRPADLAPLVTINQMAPIYIAFAVPQRFLSEVRDSVVEGTTKVEAFVPGTTKLVAGRVTMFDNTVDVTTGMVTVRATMDNADEALWPGALVNTRLTLRVEQAVVVPTPAIQVGQSGAFVFVVKDGAAEVRPVTVIRAADGQSVIGKGLTEGETVVVDGQLLLSNGTKVAPREAKAGT
jgi:membrane fusion protein, multidrug efflux system